MLQGAGISIVQGAGITAVAHAIQLAVAPVFLLSGVGAMLAVLSNRLSRIIDRGRRLEERHAQASAEAAGRIHAELTALSQRAKLISYAIACCTVTALLVCVVIAALFVGAFVSFDYSGLVTYLFVGAMLALFLGLLTFLREIFIATARLRIGVH